MSQSNLKLLGAGILIGLGLGILVLFAIFADDLLVTDIQSDQGSELMVPDIDSPAPVFELQSIKGEAVNLHDLQGRAVIVNFWATWCGPCQVEMPLLQSYHDRHNQELIVLAINVGESPQDIEKYLEELGLNLNVLLDTKGEVENLYRVRGLPTTYFIDEEGIIRYIHLGLLSESQIKGYLANLGVLQ